MDDRVPDITVDEFRQIMLDAADRVHVVQPESLREPLAWWLRAVEESARSWKHLHGRTIVYEWNMAQAVLNAHRAAETTGP